MWLDVCTKLAEVEGRTPSTTATNWAVPAPRVAEVASAATPPRLQLEPMPLARADGLDPDADANLDWWRLHGPATYGAMASAMGRGATRAWRAEAKPRAAGLVLYREGWAVPMVRRNVMA